MARVRLELPERLDFSTELEVLVGHVNYGGHLGNDALLGLLHEARVRFLASLGHSEQSVEGCGLIMADAAVVYRAEAFHGDRLTVEVGVGDFTRSGCDLYYRVTRRGDGRPVADAKTGLVFFDYATRRPLPVPEGFRARFAGR